MIGMVGILQKTRPLAFPAMETARAMQGIALESRAKIDAAMEEFLEPSMAMVSNLIRKAAGDGFYFVEARAQDIFPRIMHGGPACHQDALACMVRERLEGMGFKVKIKGGGPDAALPMVIDWFRDGGSEGVAQGVGSPAV